MPGQWQDDHQKALAHHFVRPGMEPVWATMLDKARYRVYYRIGVGKPRPFNNFKAGSLRPVSCA